MVPNVHEIKLAGQRFAKSPIQNFLENPTNCLVDDTRSRVDDGRTLSPHNVVCYIVRKESLNLFKETLQYKSNRQAHSFHLGMSKQTKRD
jgi:hypothetical protein